MRSSLIRRIAAIAGLVLAVGLFAIAPAQAQYIDGIQCDLIADDGSTVTISGEGYEPGTEVAVSINQDGVTAPLGTTTADATTAFSETFPYPTDTFDNTAPATYTAVGLGADGEDDVLSTTPRSQESPALDPDPCTIAADVLSETVTPTPEATTEPTSDVLGDLAFTGSSTMPMITIAVGAIALGSLVLFGVRTRRSES
ncbi:MAG: hypothetical protein RIE08_07910 [Acidimicrobiales bacterium]